ncbi:MAG: methyl-accepting chemotaxis protein, partial [Fervidobacterium sp.]
MKNVPIFWKITLISIVLIIFMVGIGVLAVVQLRNKTISKTEQNLKSLAENSAGEFWNFIQGHAQLVDLLSKEANVTGVFKNESNEEEWMKKLFDKVIKSYPNALFVYVGLKDGRMYLIPETKLPEGYDPRTRPWYKDAVSNAGQIIITEPYEDASTGQLVITIAKTVQTNEGITGVVGLDFDCSKLASQLLQKGKELGYLNAVVSNNGTIILHSIKEYVGRNVKDTDFFKKWQSGAESGVFKYIFDGKARYTGYKRLPNGWIYASLVLEKDLMREANNMTLTFSVVIAVAVLLAAVIAFVISRNYVVKPINSLTEVAKRVSAGDLTVQFKVDSNDEIGILGKTLESMVTALRGMAQQIQGDSSTVRQEAGQVAAVSEEVSATIEELTAQVENVGTNVNNASAAIEELTSGIEEVAASAQNVANASQKLSEEAQKVSNLANEGQKAIDNITNVIVQTKAKANVTYETVER